MRWILHLHERDLCRDSDLSVRDLYGRINMRRFRGDMFAQSDVPVLSNMSEYEHVRDPDMRGLEHMSRLLNLPWGGDLSATTNIRANAGVWAAHFEWPTHVPWITNLPRLTHVRRCKLRRLGNMPGGDMYGGGDNMFTIRCDMRAPSHMSGESLV